MLNKKLARRYAKALLEIGKEKNQVAQYQKELSAFAEAVDRVSELRNCLTSPLYSAEEIKPVIGALAKKFDVSDTVRNFLFLLVDKRRAHYLADIVESLNDLANDLFGYARATIITAAPLVANEYDNLKLTLEAVTKKKILLDARVDPQIIGGVIAEVGDKVFDGSIRTQLHKIGETLI